jgi:cytoskeletal protein CcmA (bactofilin family)
MSWFRKRPDPPPTRVPIPAERPRAALPAAQRPPAEPSLEIDLDAPDDSGVGTQRTVIAIDTTVKGHVTTASDLFVAGQIDGDVESGAAVHVANEGIVAGDITALRVRVDAGAGVDGEINASDIYIEGRVRGNVAAGGRLELGGSADVIGDVRARTLHVEEGATLQGRCTSG